jgi:hypothetical protein
MSEQSTKILSIIYTNKKKIIMESATGIPRHSTETATTTTTTTTKILP